MRDRLFAVNVGIQFTVTIALAAIFIASPRVVHAIWLVFHGLVNIPILAASMHLEEDNRFS